MKKKKTCKICNETQFDIYPNGYCQKCLSLKFEGDLRKMGGEVELDAETLINDYLVHFKSMRQIAKENLIKPYKVRKYLKEYGIPVRDTVHANTKYVNKDIFKELNVSSAFLLGYIFTDGDLLLNEQTGLYFLRVYSKFKYKIEAVKKILSAEAKIQYRKPQSHKGRNQSEMFFLHIANQDIINDLVNYGMVLNKNEEIKFPDIPDNLIPHFIRGAWSGSGCVTTYKNTILSTFVNGSYDFITEIERILNEKGLKKRNIYKAKHTKKPSYCIKYATRDSELLYRYMYRGATQETTCIKQKTLYNEYFGFNQPKLF